MIIDKAFRLAAIYHHGQVRKYTGEPYVTHPVDVMAILAEHYYFGRDSVSIQHMLAAALLHDTLEDTYATEEALRQEMPEQVVDFVLALTDVDKNVGNRKTRKALDRARLAEACAEVQSIKCADIISNSRSIKMHDAKFWETYKAELSALLDVLTDAHPDLRRLARDSLI